MSRGGAWNGNGARKSGKGAGGEPFSESFRQLELLFGREMGKLARITGSALAALILGLAAQASEVATGDGLRLQFDARGRVAPLIVGGARLPMSGPGGFFVADVAAIPVREAELCPNGGFEDLQGGAPVAWSVGADWSPDDTVARSGARSMKVVIAGPEKRRSGNLSVDVPVKPNTPYRVSMWMRTEGGAPSYYIVQMDASGASRPDYPQICISHARTHSDWFQIKHSFVTAPFCRKLRVYANLWEQTGQAWIDDVSVVSLEDDYVTPQKALSGALKTTGSVLKCTYGVPESGLRLTATYRGRPDHILVDAELEDTSGRDRAVTASFRLPIRAAGWTWFDDIHNAQQTAPGTLYGAGRLHSDRRVISLYPFACLGNERTAVAMAVPMDWPRPFRLCYEADKGFFINYEFGLTRHAAKFPGRANFRFLIYPCDAKWGFRSAAQRYYEIFPESFQRRLDRLGGAGFMADLATVEAPGYCFPVAAIWDYWKRESLDAYRRELTKLYAYTEMSGWWGWAIGITAEQAKERQPSREEAWARVEELARREPPHEVAQCIINCAPYDREGKPVLSDAYVPEWGGYNYACNPDPEVTGPAGDINRYKLTLQREVSAIDTFGLDGMYFDCIFVSTTDNFRVEHFRWADHPLAFDHVTKRPVLPMAFSVFEAVKAVSDDIHARGLTVLSNYSVTDHITDPFCIQFIDLIGNEMLWTWTTDAKLSLQRTLAYQKPISMSWQEAKTTWPKETIERELKQAMFYGTFYWLSNLSPEIYDRWVPLTARLAEAGWEPVTFAHVTGPVMIERFGRAKDGNLHFTLRNDTDQPRTVEVRLDAASLGLTGLRDVEVWLVRDSWTFDRLETHRSSTEWTLSVTVPPTDTVVLRVAGKACLALDQLCIVPDLLRKGANYREALARAGAAVTAPDCAQVLSGVLEVVGAVRQGAAGARGNLLGLAQILSAPVAQASGEQQQRWAQRLSDLTTQARTRILAAAEAL